MPFFKYSIDYIHNIVYTISTNKKGRTPKMTAAERKAITARTNDLIKQGINKELAKVMAKVELEAGMIKVVVNYNN